MADMHTPLKHVRGLGSAKTGTARFWAQRLTAVANIPLTLFLIASLLALVGADYPTVRGYLANPMVSIVLLLLILSGTWHMCLGMQVMIEDYVHGHRAKFALLIFNVFFSTTVALACFYAVLRISLHS